MKKCTWCGKEYGEDAERCLIDGAPLASREEIKKQSKPTWTDYPLAPANAAGRVVRHSSTQFSPTTHLIDLNRIDGAFEWAEGYSRPDWKVIREAIKATVLLKSQPRAWAEAAFQWAQQLRLDLGGQYEVRRSQEFVLVSTIDLKRAQDLLLFAERTLAQIYAWLKMAAWRTADGKHVILLFEDQEDYYQYVSYFLPDGVHPASGGCLLHRDYVHIALPFGNGGHVRATLAHELVHNSVVHLKLPLWLNEGLAVTFNRSIASATDRQRSMLDGDLKERHLAFWNPTNIQKFWSGVSFREAGDSNELSYSLAEIVLNLLVEASDTLPAFVQAARWEDAGQDAALAVMGKDLGQVMATFLGEDNWRPNRKAIAQSRKAQKTPDGDT
jgi:hypothetical protein